MKKKLLAIGISTVSVIILILTSLTNVVGYQTVQTSQQNIIKERINQRELLFQTIVDIANNKEIQRIILKSQICREIYKTSEFPVITTNQVKIFYYLVLILSKVVNKSRIQSILQKYQIPDSEIKQEINTIIEKNATLSGEISHISKLNTRVNSTFFQILIWIIITSLSFISVVISGFPMVILLSIWWLAKTVEVNHGVKIVGDVMIYIIESIALISFTIFFVSLVILWICFGMPGMP
jgi:hypothetical protein